MLVPLAAVRSAAKPVCPLRRSPKPPWSRFDSLGEPAGLEARSARQPLTCCVRRAGDSVEQACLHAVGSTRHLVLRSTSEFGGKMTTSTLSVIVPVYNEQFLVQASLSRLRVLGQSYLLQC